MTDKLHCPFCHKELFEDVINSNYVACRNYHCKFSGGVVHKDILQSIIDGKKAQDALNRARQKLDLIAFHTGEDCHIARELRTIAKDGLDEITSITESKI